MIEHLWRQRQRADARKVSADDTEVERGDREPAGDRPLDRAPRGQGRGEDEPHPSDNAPCATSAAGNRRDARSSCGRSSVPAASDASSGLM